MQKVAASMENIERDPGEEELQSPDEKPQEKKKSKKKRKKSKKGPNERQNTINSIDDDDGHAASWEADP